MFVCAFEKDSDKEYLPDLDQSSDQYSDQSSDCQSSNHYPDQSIEQIKSTLSEADEYRFLEHDESVNNSRGKYKFTGPYNIYFKNIN